jgi:hypothetical protein
VRALSLLYSVRPRVRIVAALIVAAVAVVFATERSPASGQSASEASARGTKFVSTRYGYEIVLVGNYRASYAVVNWTGGFPFGGGGEVDVITDSRDRKFIVAAKRVSAGTTLRKWEAFRIANMRDICENLRAFRDTTLGGVAAREFMTRCPSYDVIVVSALHHRHGYIFQFLSPTPNVAASDRRIFDAGRRTFRFTAK